MWQSNEVCMYAPRGWYVALEIRRRWMQMASVSLPPLWCSGTSIKHQAAVCSSHPLSLGTASVQTVPFLHTNCLLNSTGCIKFHLDFSYTGLVSTLHFVAWLYFVYGWSAMLQTGRSLVRVLINLLNFLNLHNPSSRTVPLGLTQPLTELSARWFLWGQSAAGS
jgi:hypothetical protein